MKKTLKSALMASVAVASMLLPTGANAQLLWEVSGNGAKESSYLFGTHHIAPATMMDSVKGMKDAMKGVDKVYGEVVMSELLAPQAQMGLATKYLMAPADSTLSKVLSVEQLDSVNNLLGRLSGGAANVSMLEVMKPALVSAQLLILENMKMFPDFNPQQQLDGMIQDFATAAGIPIGGLETPEDQMVLLYGKPISIQADELMKGIREFDDEAEKAKKLAAAYVGQDFDALAELFKIEEDAESESMKELLYDRNDSWMKIIKSKLPEESMFIAVGAGHLVGDHGLIQQLRQAGYTVTPVK